MTSTTAEMTREEAIASVTAAAPENMTLRPYSPGPKREDRAIILIRLVPPDSQIGSIIVPDSVQKFSGEAVVIDTGKGAYDPDTDSYHPLLNLTVGDRIVIGKYVGTEVLFTREIPKSMGDRIIYERVQEKYTAMYVKDVMAKYEDMG